jgi:hypothetical protein
MGAIFITHEGSEESVQIVVGKGLWNRSFGRLTPHNRILLKEVLEKLGVKS